MERSHETTRRQTGPPFAPAHVLLAGGGTAGHIFPALAVADELATRGWRVSFVGARTGLEARLVPAKGVAFHTLPARPLVGQGAVGKAKALVTLARSSLGARNLVLRLGADVLLGTGGYVSAPAVLGGRLARRPVLLVEPNAHAGVANRWLSRVAAEAAVSYEVTRAELHCPSRVIGTPVRADFFSVPDLAESLPSAEPRALRRILVLGGSQGAEQLNRLLPPVVDRLSRRFPNLEVTHQCGEPRLTATRLAYAELETTARVEVVPFLEDVAAAMARSHLVVSRAGALTVAEICAAGRPSVLVPLTAAMGHQAGNAAVLAEQGAARLLSGERAEPESLGGVLEQLLAAPETLAEMARAAKALARPDAARFIADRVEALRAARLEARP